MCSTAAVAAELLESLMRTIIPAPQGGCSNAAPHHSGSNDADDGPPWNSAREFEGQES